MTDRGTKVVGGLFLGAELIREQACLRPSRRTAGFSAIMLISPATRIAVSVRGLG